jgi:thioredoxin
MRILLLSSIVILLTFSCSPTPQNNYQHSASSNAEAFIKDVDAATFKKLADAGQGIILDVRTPEEIAQGYIEHASMIDYYDEDFAQKINLIDKSKEIYVYCKSGGRSSSAAKVLKENGFTRIYQLDNGIMGWEDMGYPLVKSDSSTDDHIQTLTVAELDGILKTDKPVLIDFHTIWCAPCKKMAPVIDDIEQKYKDKAIVMRVDADKSKDVAKAYKIKGVPVFILYKNGHEIWKHTGMIEEEAIVAQIEKAL